MLTIRLQLQPNQQENKDLSRNTQKLFTHKIYHCCFNRIINLTNFFSLQFILRCNSIAVDIDSDSLSNKSFHYRNEFLISINEKKKTFGNKWLCAVNHFFDSAFLFFNRFACNRLASVVILFAYSKLAVKAYGPCQLKPFYRSRFMKKKNCS